MSLDILIEIGQALERKANAALAHTAGISWAEYRLLAKLDQAGEGGLSRVELAEAVSLTPSGVSRALQPLAKIGLVENVKAQRDARQSRALLTPAGEAAVANCRPMIEESFAELPAFPLPGESLEAYYGELMRPRAPVFGNRPRSAR